jgi:hypothetical protein
VWPPRLGFYCSITSEFAFFVRERSVRERREVCLDNFELTVSEAWTRLYVLCFLVYVYIVNVL